MIATCSEDGSIKIWEIPDIGVLVNMDDSKALLSLDYHERRCIQIEWHPIASNVLLSVSQEPKVCVWNLDEGVAEVEIECHPDIIWNAAWSGKGDKIVTSCKDKKLRIFDARSGDLLVVCFCILFVDSMSFTLNVLSDKLLDQKDFFRRIAF